MTQSTKEQTNSKDSAGTAPAPLTTTLHVRIAKELDRAIELVGAKLDIPKRQIVEDALRLWLESRAA